MGKGKNIAYVRVSTIEQNEARQKEALEKYEIDETVLKYEELNRSLYAKEE